MDASSTVTAQQWLTAIDAPDATLAGRLVAACGGETPTPERLDGYRRALERFAREFGADRPVTIVRVPGRLNVLGRHADHRGGYVNPIALAQEVVLVFSPAGDDCIDVVNVDDAYGRRTFRIAERAPRDPLAEVHAWLDWTQDLARDRAAAHDWEHKLAAPPVYLAQMVFRDRTLRGFSGVIAGSVPPRRGLSSSSAVVIASMLAMVEVNDLPLTREELIPHCGVAEWYVGTRGGCGDHAAILCAKRGHLTHVRTVPDLVVAGHFPVPPEYHMVVFYSGHDADKTGAAGNTFNERVACYEIADLFAARFLRERPATIETVGRVHMGDIAERLDAATIYALLQSVPERASRDEIRRALPDDDAALERQFATHTELPEGYRLRGALTFGIAECTRSAQAPELLARGDIAAFGRWMNISHDGDRVSGTTCVDAVPKGTIEATRAVWEHPGGYDCSTVAIDHMVDIALSAGALGAQVTAAGLGGSMMALVKADDVDRVVQAMTRDYFAPEGVAPNHLVAVPSAGAAYV